MLHARCITYYVLTWNWKLIKFHFDHKNKTNNNWNRKNYIICTINYCCRFKHCDIIFFLLKFIFIENGNGSSITRWVLYYTSRMTKANVVFDYTNTISCTLYFQICVYARMWWMCNVFNVTRRMYILCIICFFSYFTTPTPEANRFAGRTALFPNWILHLIIIYNSVTKCSLLN